eukprot:GHVQ01002916.1.p2 GENE.GHVQ01002916.1~~GHVQ01002916.1.p2  ORF type:complete len:117 (+),score=10.32 GHVQ01002916.1:1037-1387(+)
MPLIMAGLYDVREDAYSFTVITMESEGTPLEAVHNRMPALLTQKTARRWLSGDEFSTVIQEVAKESKQLAQKSISHYRVGTEVSKMCNDEFSCVMPAKPGPPPKGNLITDYFKPKK